ncbi:MAG: O-antigen ligase family protein [Patescibacteria group bacterium]
MISKKQTFVFLAIYIGLRVFSYFFHPGNFLNTFIAALILFSTIYFLLKNDQRGWYIVATEIFLGGTENFLEIGGISLRTLLLVFSAVIFIWQKIKSKEIRAIINSNKIFCALASVLYIWIAFTIARGYLAGHNAKEIISDVIPYLFLFYYFPLRELLQSDRFKKIAAGLLTATVFGNLIFILFTFAFYSANILHLQDAYYHWFRDIANGKITGYDFNFYRIVLNEQLLLIPLLLYFISQIIKQSQKIYIYLALSLLIILPINFTRIYILALPVGLLFLFNKTRWKRWLICSAAAIAIFFLSFTLIHSAASRGQSLGWEFFGIRLQSIAMPQIEDSSLSRMILLPAILDKIKVSPILGNGLGDTVTAYIPMNKQTITTAQFDWGYLEIIDEMGIIGMLIWITILAWIICSICKSDSQSKNGLITSVIALMVINITSPALFHVMGIILFTVIVAHASSKQLPSPLHNPQLS